MMNIIHALNRRPTKYLYSHCTRHYTNNKHPAIKTWNVMKQDVLHYFGKQEEFMTEHADVVIIGGGIIGSSVAYWMKTRAGKGISVAVIEKDPTVPIVYMFVPCILNPS